MEVMVPVGIRNLSQFVISPGLKHAPNIKLKEILSASKELTHKLKDLEGKIERHDEEIKAIFDAIRQLMMPQQKKVRRIGF